MPAGADIVRGALHHHGQKQKGARPRSDERVSRLRLTGTSCPVRQGWIVRAIHFFVATVFDQRISEC